MNETPDHLLRQLPAVYGMLGVVIVMGLVGNIIVILVYLNRPHQQSATFFIIVLACVDIFSCAVSIPFTIAIEAMEFRMYSLTLCKVYYFLYISSIPFGSLLISAIAVDRYLYICYPMKRLMTTKRAKAVTLALFCLATCIGVGAIFTVRLRVQERTNVTIPFISDNETDSDEVTDVPSTPVRHSLAADQHLDLVPMCEETAYLPNTTVVEKTLHLVVQQLNHGCYWLSIACVTLLYGMIFVTVIRLRRKRVIRLTLAHQSRVSMSTQMRALDDNFPPTDRITTRSSLRYAAHPPRRQNSLSHSTALRRGGPRRQSSPDNDNASKAPNGASGGSSTRTQRQTTTSFVEPSEETTDLSTGTRSTSGRHSRAANGTTKRSLLPKTSLDLSAARQSVNRLLARHMLQTIKSAAILFVVSVVFILTCLPALLMANKQVEMNLILYYLFYANHATNPLIYCFMNRSFREDLANIVRRRMVHRRSFM